MCGGGASGSAIVPVLRMASDGQRPEMSTQTQHKAAWQQSVLQLQKSLVPRQKDHGVETTLVGD